MLSTPGRTGDQIMQEATLIDQKYEDDAKSQNFLFVQNIQLLFPSLPRREARKLMMDTPHRRRIIFLLDSRSQLLVLSCTCWPSCPRSTRTSWARPVRMRARKTSMTPTTARRSLMKIFSTMKRKRMMRRAGRGGTMKMTSYAFVFNLVNCLRTFWFRPLLQSM